MQLHKLVPRVGPLTSVRHTARSVLQVSPALISLVDTTRSASPVRPTLAMEPARIVPVEITAQSLLEATVVLQSLVSTVLTHPMEVLTVNSVSQAMTVAQTRLVRLQEPHVQLALSILVVALIVQTVERIRSVPSDRHRYAAQLSSMQRMPTQIMLIVCLAQLDKTVKISPCKEMIQSTVLQVITRRLLISTADLVPKATHVLATELLPQRNAQQEHTLTKVKPVARHAPQSTTQLKDRNTVCPCHLAIRLIHLMHLESQYAPTRLLVDGEKLLAPIV